MICGFPYQEPTPGGMFVRRLCGLVKGHDGAHGVASAEPSAVDRQLMGLNEAMILHRDHLIRLTDRVAELEDRCKYVPAPELFLKDVREYNEMRSYAERAARSELLASLPPCEITDPEAMEKLTPGKVRAYLKSKWLRPIDLPSCIAVEVTLEALASLEGRSQMAVYLDILGMPE